MSKVFIVYEYDYDASGIRKIFNSEVKASEYVKACELEDKDKPAYYRRYLDVHEWEVQ